jgi:two-component system sensor histidine kinase AlgZ
MHPVFTRARYLALYLTAWIPLGLILAVLVRSAGRMTLIESAAVIAPSTLVLAYVCLSPWHICRALPLRTTPIPKILAQHLLAALFSSAIVLLLTAGIAALLVDVFPGLDQRLRPAMPVHVAMLFLIYLLSITAHYVALTLQASAEAHVLAREAELRALKSQINPHFLFNSLHSISALTTVDPARARDMCIRLSDFFRNSLRMGEREAIHFREEVELARIYLDVEQVRFGNRLRVVQELDAACDECEVPPLLVQPLVENAIKHGIATMVDGGQIALRSRCFRKEMRFTVENPFDPEAASTRGTGVGLTNVRNRLRARYGSAAKLEIEVEGDCYRAIVSLPCGETE